MYSFIGHCRNFAFSLTEMGGSKGVARSALCYKKTALANVPGLDWGLEAKVETGRLVRRLLVIQVR